MILAEFDDTAEPKTGREAQAKYGDLSHQLEQKRAEHNSNAEKRQSDLQGAQADLDATAHVGSLKPSSAAHGKAELAEIKIVELQRDRQKIAVD